MPAATNVHTLSPRQPAVRSRPDAATETDVVPSLLRVLRRQLMLDAVFVAEFIEGRRIFRHVEADGAVTSVHVGDSVPLDETLCARIADGRLDALLPDLPAVQRRRQLPPLPITIGSYIGVPLRLRDGRLFGMLCGFTCEVSAFLDERDVDRMQVAADLIAGLFDADH